MSIADLISKVDDACPINILWSNNIIQINAAHNKFVDPRLF